MTGLGTSGTGSPVLVNGLYQYVTSLPPFMAVAADSGIYFRVVVATSLANLLSSRCAYRDNNTIMIQAITCGIILDADFVDFSGVVSDKQAQLKWITTGEQNLLRYEIESSPDGINFKPIGIEYAKNLPRATYLFKDAANLNGPRFYRLKMINQNNSIKYSSVIKLNGNSYFEVSHLTNPFANLITADVTVPEASPVHINLYDGKGRLVNNFARNMNKGFNKLEIKEPGNLPPGIYFITLEYRNEVFRTKLVKR